MVFAQIRDGTIQNVIVLNDPSLEHVFVGGFDALVRIDNLDPVPQIGWLYDGQSFSMPPSED